MPSERPRPQGGDTIEAAPGQIWIRPVAFSHVEVHKPAETSTKYVRADLVHPPFAEAQALERERVLHIADRLAGALGFNPVSDALLANFAKGLRDRAEGSEGGTRQTC